MPVSLAYASTREAARLLSEGLVVVPFGSLEQHCNGPLGLDALLAEAIAWRSCLILEARRGVTCAIAPTLYYGFSPEWAAAPGTVTLTARGLLEAASSILDSLARHGARRIALLNGHAGNSGLLEAAAREAALRSRIVVGIVDYWRAAGVPLGHCLGLEEDLARGLLGLEVDCSCPVEAEAGRVRIAAGPIGEAGIRGGRVDAGRVIEAVADALYRVYAASPGDPVV